MPQLDILYISTTYLWTWYILHLISQKIKTHLITALPPTNILTPPSPTTTLPWM